MKRLLLIIGLSFASIALFAERHIGFEGEAFRNALAPDCDVNTVFSPVSFEIDCALVAESLETIPKAGVSETMGVVIDFESMYAPIAAALSERTNSISFVSARAFCVPDITAALPAHCQHLERVYGAEVMQFEPKQGLEAWFRTSMEGSMEHFELASDEVRSDRYSFYDLVSVSVEWQDPFPLENNRRLPFRMMDGATNRIEFMSDIRLVTSWELKGFVLMRLPLKGGAFFYAMLPKGAGGLTKLMEQFSGNSIGELIATTKNEYVPERVTGPALVVLPKFNFRSRLEIGSAMQKAKVPLQGLKTVAGGLPPHEYVQYASFALNEHGKTEKPLVKKPAELEVRATEGMRRLIFNRPFVFFVYHEPTAAILVAGQYTGKE